jgi:hypothetical protein
MLAPSYWSQWLSSTGALSKTNCPLKPLVPGLSTTQQTRTDFNKEKIK